jgi:hypothetical protein
MNDINGFADIFVYSMLAFLVGSFGDSSFEL